MFVLCLFLWEASRSYIDAERLTGISYIVGRYVRDRQPRRLVGFELEHRSRPLVLSVLEMKQRKNLVELTNIR